MGRPPKFSRAQVQNAALVLVDQHGLDALTMRNVAAELGTGPMTLYGHVQDRADLEALVVDAVFSEVEIPTPAPDPATRIEDLCVAAWKVLRRHPHAARLTLTRRTDAPSALRLGELLAVELGTTTLTGRRLLVAFRVLLSLIVGSIESDLAPVDPGDDERRVSVTESDYPALAALSASSARTTPEQLFRDTVRAGLVGVLPQASPDNI
ncbi:TetR/AcrR family transcriptional regulator [Kribbella sp. NPDC023855]|uniref:TetR/AcrR family transcriptional regulator n=1 Tax=Kribbella sp. NPDC023855 TaxID=3154698 RepID=UPI0033FBAC56